MLCRIARAGYAAAAEGDGSACRERELACAAVRAAAAADVSSRADGSYEKILKAEKHKIRVLTDKRISDLNDNVNTDVKISTEKNRERLEAELLANKEFMEKLARTQAEILQTAIDKWREEELDKINENPSA